MLELKERVKNAQENCFETYDDFFLDSYLVDADLDFGFNADHPETSDGMDPLPSTSLYRVLDAVVLSSKQVIMVRYRNDSSLSRSKLCSKIKESSIDLAESHQSNSKSTGVLLANSVIHPASSSALSHFHA